MDFNIENPAVFTSQFLDSIHQHSDGHMKSASEAGSHMTRRKLREDAFSPAIIPHEEVTDSDLDRFLDMEHPAIIHEMEPDSFGAKTISFEDTGDTVPFYGDKYLLTFYSNTTPEWTKDINLLRTYRGDIREIITDNSLRDLARKKDVKFMSEVEEIVGAVPGGISPLTRLKQYVHFAGKLTRNSWVDTQLFLQDRDLPNGVFLMNRRTFAEFRRWTREEIGGDFAQDLLKEGAGAFEKASLSGIDFIVTMKTDLVPNGVIYQFTKPNYLGRAGVLEKPTMYVKKEKDILRFSCKEILGVAIANVAGIQKVQYNEVADPTYGQGLPVT